MTEEQINDILQQIEVGKEDRHATYCCCGESFDSLYDFRKHLYCSHPEELELYFEDAIHREPQETQKGEVHRLAKRGRKKKEAAKRRKENKKARDRNANAYPNAAKGDHFHLIYTPMGNKR